LARQAAAAGVRRFVFISSVNHTDCQSTRQSVDSNRSAKRQEWSTSSFAHP
jgi:hypothetical protein